MPVLRNSRHELFAQEIVKGTGNADSYIASGYDVSKNVASAAATRLLKDRRICSRIAELHRRGVDRAVVTVESLIREVDEARALAMSINQPAAAVAAIKEKGVLSGKRVERSEQGLPGEFAELDGMTTDELRAYLTAEGEALSLRQQAAADGGRARGTGKSVH